MGISLKGFGNGGAQVAGVKTGFHQTNQAPEWITAELTNIGTWYQDVYKTSTTQLQATDPEGDAVVYEVTDNSSLSVDNNGYVSGIFGGTDPADAPLWSGPTTFTVNEGDVVDFQFNVVPNGSGTSIDILGVNGFLPWGMNVNRTTQKLEGTIQNFTYNEGIFEITPKPTWNTSEILPIHNESETISLSLDATNATKYSIIDGHMPWGWILNPTTGAISGVANQVDFNGDIIEVSPKPVFSSSGTLGTFNEGDAVNVSVSATSATLYTLINGGLPWGTTLNTTTGAITGTTEGVDTNTTFTFTIRAYNDSDAFEDEIFNITVNDIA